MIVCDGIRDHLEMLTGTESVDEIIYEMSLVFWERCGGCLFNRKGLALLQDGYF